MRITLDQAHVLLALDREGSYEKASLALNKAHTALLYAVRSLEAELKMKIFQRVGRRSQMTDSGRELLRHCEKLIQAESEVYAFATQLAGDWDPSLKIVYDGLIDSSEILMAVAAFRKLNLPTKVLTFTGFLSDVEDDFHRHDADLMISVLPMSGKQLEARALNPITASLVAHRNHPLFTRGKKLDVPNLRAHSLITLRGSDERLELPTRELHLESSIHVGDFHSKRNAILSGLGYGWLPDYLIRKELQNGLLKRLPLSFSNVHKFQPFLIWRKNRPLSRAALAFLKELGVKDP